MTEQVTPADVLQAYQEHHEPGEAVGADHIHDRINRVFRHERAWIKIPELRRVCDALASQRDDVKVWTGSQASNGGEEFYISIGRPLTPEERFEAARQRRRTPVVPSP